MTKSAAVMIWLALLAADRYLDVTHQPQATAATEEAAE